MFDLNVWKLSENISVGFNLEFKVIDVWFDVIYSQYFYWDVNIMSRLWMLRIIILKLSFEYS